MVAIEAGSIIGGKYRLERPLARGGMGSVWIGRHLELGAAVAVKFIEASMAASERARARFKLEGRAAAALKSPNVVHVYDSGIEDGTPYLVMELLEGEDLDARLAREQRLSLAEAHAVLSPVFKAIQRAHEIGLVHRDLKPANIFLARDGDEEIVKVLDFGIAKWTDPDVTANPTQPGMMVGSPSYMSPEQARSREVDARSDLWSMAVIAFLALTGTLPFKGDSLPAVVMAICVDPIPPPSQLVPALGPDVDRFFERALAREPSRRFQSAREMAEAFAALAVTPEAAAARLPGRASEAARPGSDGRWTRPALRASADDGGAAFLAGAETPADSTLAPSRSGVETPLFNTPRSALVSSFPRWRTAALLGAAGAGAALGLLVYLSHHGTTPASGDAGLVVSVGATASAPAPEPGRATTAKPHVASPTPDIDVSGEILPDAGGDERTGSAAPATHAADLSPKPRATGHAAAAPPPVPASKEGAQAGERQRGAPGVNPGHAPAPPAAPATSGYGIF